MAVSRKIHKDVRQLFQHFFVESQGLCIQLSAFINHRGTGQARKEDRNEREETIKKTLMFP